MSSLNRREESLVPLIPVEAQPLARGFETGEGLKEMIGEARGIVSTFEHDLSTPASRQKTAQLAYRVSRLKTAVDKIGKGLVDDIKAKTGTIDKRRKLMRDALDDLKNEARRPLDEWEAAEAAEKARIESNIQNLLDLASIVDVNGNPYSIVALQTRRDLLKEIQVTHENFGKEWEHAGTRRSEGLDRLEATIQNLEATERQRIEAEEATRKARELQAQLDAERLDKQRAIAAEERAKRETAERELEATRAQQREQQAKEVERHQKEMAEKEREVIAQRAKLAKDHVAKIETETLEDLTIALADAWSATDLFDIIKAGNIRHLKIEY